jgi:hypothetical protein
MAILLVALYLMGTTEAYQLLKIPALVTHYFQHMRQNPDLDLMAFLREHYAEEQQLDADWQQDMQLPFKSHEDPWQQISFSYFPPQWQMPDTAPTTADADQPVSRPDAFSPVRYTPDIFQPPRA